MTRAAIAERAVMLRARLSICILQIERAPLGSEEIHHYRAAAEQHRRELAELGARAIDYLVADEGYPFRRGA